MIFLTTDFDYRCAKLGTIFTEKRDLTDDEITKVMFKHFGHNSLGKSLVLAYKRRIYKKSENWHCHEIDSRLYRYAAYGPYAVKALYNGSENITLLIGILINVPLDSKTDVNMGKHFDALRDECIEELRYNCK